MAAGGGVEHEPTDLPSGTDLEAIRNHRTHKVGQLPSRDWSAVDRDDDQAVMGQFGLRRLALPATCVVESVGRGPACRHHVAVPRQPAEYGGGVLAFPPELPQTDSKHNVHRNAVEVRDRLNKEAELGAAIVAGLDQRTSALSLHTSLSLSKTFAPLVSLLTGVGFLLCGNALLGTMIPLRGLHEHFTPVIIGLMGSSYNLGFVVGCLACPYLILRAGHIRGYSTLVSLAAATTLVHPMIVDPIVWIGARSITGFCLAGLYLIIESWLNDRATNDNRGLIMSVYIVVNFLTTTVGQLMILLAPIEHFELFAAASLLVSLAVVPVALTTSAQPAPIAIVEFRPLRLLKIAPVGLVGTFMIGVANGAFWSLVTVFAIGRGLTADGAAIFLSIAVIGGALMHK